MITNLDNRIPFIKAYAEDYVNSICADRYPEYISAEEWQRLYKIGWDIIINTLKSHKDNPNYLFDLWRPNDAKNLGINQDKLQKSINVINNAKKELAESFNDSDLLSDIRKDITARK